MPILAIFATVPDPHRATPEALPLDAGTFLLCATGTQPAESLAWSVRRLGGPSSRSALLPLARQVTSPESTGLFRGESPSPNHSRAREGKQNKLWCARTSADPHLGNFSLRPALKLWKELFLSSDEPTPTCTVPV
jgi:hypothetical protein